MGTKDISVLCCVYIDTEGANTIHKLNEIKVNEEKWLKEQQIRAFFTTIQESDYVRGAKHAMNLIGLGMLKPNMALFGFKSDWQMDIEGLDQYFATIHHCFDYNLAIGILRSPNETRFSQPISEVQDEDIYVDVKKQYDSDADHDEKHNIDRVFSDTTSLQDMPETNEEKNCFPLRSFAN